MASHVDSLAIQPNVYYTIEETAALLRVTEEAVLQLVGSGAFPGVRIANQWRILGAVLLNLPRRQSESETALVREWLAASSSSLREVWDNPEDAVYDNL